MDCELCGLPTPTTPIKIDDYAFCCFGCKEVYRCFGRDILKAPKTPVKAEVTPNIKGSEAFLMIDGMHCSSCEILIERLITRIDGVLDIATSYATSTAKVVYDPASINESELPNIINQTGYRARLRSDNAQEYDNRQPLFRLISGISLALLVMMLNAAFFYPTNLGLVDVQDLAPVSWLAFYAAPRAMFVLTTLLIFYVGLPILQGAWVGLRVRALNMDNLLVLAILAAYTYSISQIITGDKDLYFDVAAVIVAIVTTGRYFEHQAKTRATQTLTNIIENWNPKVRVNINDVFYEVNIDQVKPGDCLSVWQGEAIPVDGIIVSGQAAIDESLMTGEPFPVTRSSDEPVLGGTVITEGNLEIIVGEKVESQMDNLARVLWNTQSSTTAMQNMADRIARIFVPLVLLLATFIGAWVLLNNGLPKTALLAALTTLIVSCPCTFGLAIPLTTATAVSTALKHNIFITSGSIFEKAPHINTVAIDKTGTLSKGKMTVLKVLGQPEVAAYASAVERRSTHPIAQAIAKLDTPKDAHDLTIHPGKGATAQIEDKQVAVGSKSLFAMLGWNIPERFLDQAADLTPEDGVASYVGWDTEIRGLIITQDQQRSDWRQFMQQLKKQYRVVLLTGAERLSGYDEYADQSHTGVPPEAKAAIIHQLKKTGTVIMIGDGSNDAPALAAADLGIAFGAPTALAVDAADVVITGDRLNRVFDTLDLIKTTRRRVRQNIVWALLYNAIAIPLAMSGFLNPLFAALAMSSSSLLVVWNSSRTIWNTDTFLDNHAE